MFARIKRTAVTFFVLLAVFTAYRILAVPLVEPHRETKRVAAVSPEERKLAQEKQLQNRLGDLMRFFPPGSWETDNPIMLESDTAKLLTQHYDTLPDGRLKLTPCTVIYMPRQNGPEVPLDRRRIIIMQAPEGAILEFDQPVDLNAGTRGKLVGAVMDGPITIQSGPTRPEGGDDFFATTHDVKMADNVITTPNPVDFRFGQSYGHGRNMRIELLPDEASAGKHSGVSASGIQSFELTNDVSMHLQSASSNIMPGDGQTGAAVNASANPNAQPQPAGSNRPAQPPADIRCQGPFQFDLVSNIATFHDEVLVLRPSPIAQGPEDQMHGDLLNVYFEPRETKPDDKDKTQATDDSKQPSAAAKKSGSKNSKGHSAGNSGGNSNGKSGNGATDDAAGETTDGAAKPAASGSHMQQLVARSMEIKGNPAIIHAPSNGLEARGQHFLYEPNRTGGQLGNLDSKGPGWLCMTNVDNPGRRFEARWSRELKMRPQDDLHVLSIMGDAWVSSSDQGEM
ncbi:MAG TPA: hypothetical protein VGJ15_14070, partial [Pirellulales bacterium]